MRLVKNEAGITLLEVLLTLAILSFVGTIIWSVFIQGSKFASTSVTKNHLQQEANIISTTLTKFHQTTDSYVITGSYDKIAVSGESKGRKMKEVFDNNLYTYEISVKKTDNDTPINSTTIDPNLTDVNVSITITDRRDENNRVSITTTLSRLKNSAADDN